MNVIAPVLVDITVQDTQETVGLKYLTPTKLGGAKSAGVVVC